MNYSVKESAVRQSLETLYQRAIKEKLWFHSRYQDLWFSPKEIKARWDKKEFLWSSENWTLRDPQERLTEIQSQITSLEVQKFKFQARISESLRNP